MLLALAGSVDMETGKRLPLNKSQLQKRADITGRQTILNLVSQFDRSGWLDRSIGQWRKGRHTRYYALNDIGLRMAQFLYPELRPKGEHTATPDQLRDMDLKALDFILDQFRQAMIRGKSVSNYEWAFIMTADARGQLSWRLKSRELSRSMRDSKVEPRKV